MYGYNRTQIHIMKYIYSVDAQIEKYFVYFSSRRKAVDYCISQGCDTEKHKTEYSTEMHSTFGYVLTVRKELVD